MKITTKILLIVIVVLLIVSGVFGYLYKKNRSEAKRQTANVENLIKAKNQELQLTRDEFSRSEAQWKVKIDSLLKSEKIALKKVKVVTIINTQYRDTGSVKIVYKDPIQKPDKSYSIPVSYSDKCWGMAGQILTIDPNAKLLIDKRTTSNSSQLLVTRSRFLGFLWWKKGESFKAYTDCGEVNFTKIIFTKK